MALSSGTRLGPYEILELLGRGGMGEVYRARDARLGRDVAIKILPAHFAHDTDRLRRFEREARAAGALNHPNIISVFDVGRHGDTPFVVTELLEGATLRQRLEHQRLPLGKTIDYALQMAQGLAAANDNGVVHRDLKPENVFITRDEHVKILDFGLAKLKTREADGTEDTIATRSVDTERGVVLGTVGYMSPEQVRGERTDHRSDIFSFGSIIYEMLTGVRAFDATSAVETMNAILKEEPAPISGRAPAVPRSLAALVHRCLSKLPQERFQSARDLAFSISAVAIEGSSIVGDRGIVPRRTLRNRAVLVIAMLVVVAFAAGVLIARRMTSLAPARTISVHRLTHAIGLEEFPAISPDGKSVAFVADAGGKRAVFVRLIAGGPALQITRDASNPESPRWSPDSAALLYYVPPAAGELQGAIWEASALGGAPRRIVSALGGVDVSDDGKQLTFFDFDRHTVRLMVSTRDGADARVVAQLDPGWTYLTPRWSPDGTSIAYQRASVNTHEAFIVVVAGAEPQQVVRDSGLLNGIAWLRDGSGLVFSCSRGATVLYLPTFNLWTIHKNGEGLRQLTFGETSYEHPDVNRAGTLVASRVRMQFDVWRFPTNGAPAANTRQGVRVTRQTGQVQTPSVAPDGDHLVYLSDAGGHGNLWVLQISTGETRQITFEQNPDIVMGVPLWSPAGDQIAFYTAPTVYLQGGYSLIRPDGSGLRRLVPEGFWASWSPDGRWFYYAGRPRQGLTTAGLRVEKLDITRGEVVVVRSENSFGPAPDGRTLYFLTQVPSVAGTFDMEVRIASPEDGPSRVLTRIPSHRLPAWQRVQLVISPDGRWLAVPLTDGATTNLWAVSTSDGSLRQVTDFGQQPTFIVRRVSWSPDGGSIFAALGEGDADIVLLAESPR